MNFVTFNQDHSHLAVGTFHLLQAFLSTFSPSSTATSRGFHIYTTEPFSKCFETKQGDIALLEMLFSTSLVALILSPRRLRITNTKVRRLFMHGRWERQQCMDGKRHSELLGNILWNEQG